MLHLRPLGQLSVCIFQSAFSSLNFRSKNFWREKQERTLKNIRFLILKALINRGFSGGRNDQVAVKFRVRAVITTSIPLRICSAGRILLLLPSQKTDGKDQKNGFLSLRNRFIHHLPSGNCLIIITAETAKCKCENTMFKI